MITIDVGVFCPEYNDIDDSTSSACTRLPGRMEVGKSVVCSSAAEVVTASWAPAHGRDGSVTPGVRSELELFVGREQPGLGYRRRSFAEV